MDYNNISIAFRKTFYFRDIIFRSSIDSIKEFSLSSYPEETTHYELYRRVNLFFFSRLDSSLSLSLGGREITRENVWKLTRVFTMTFSPISPSFFFSSTHYEGNYRLTFSYLDPLEFPRRPATEDFISPYRFSTISFLFFSLALLPGFFILSLSLSFSTIVTTVSKETEINRDNIYLSPREERERKEKTNLTKNIDLILTSSFLIIIFPCTSLKKNIIKKKKRKRR